MNQVECKCRSKMLKIAVLFLFVAVSMLYLPNEGAAMQKNGIQCGCHYPRIFRPVCGDDNVTYDNSGVIRCVNICNGTDLKVLHHGSCAGTP